MSLNVENSLISIKIFLIIYIALDIDRAFNTSGSPSTEMSFQTATRKTPENFLGPNSNLVNLDALVSTKNSGS